VWLEYLQEAQKKISYALIEQYITKAHGSLYPVKNGKSTCSVWQGFPDPLGCTTGGLARIFCIPEGLPYISYS